MILHISFFLMLQHDFMSHDCFFETRCVNLLQKLFNEPHFVIYMWKKKVTNQNESEIIIH